MLSDSIDAKVDEIRTLISALQSQYNLLSPQTQNLVDLEVEQFASRLQSLMSDSLIKNFFNEFTEKSIHPNSIDTAHLDNDERPRVSELDPLMDAVPAIIWMIRDSEAMELYSNRLGYEFLGMVEGADFSKGAPQGKRLIQPYRNYKNGKEIPHNELPMQVVAATGVGINNYEFDLVFDDGVVKTVLGNVVPLYDQANQPHGAVGAFLDITDRKRMENQLRDSESRLQTWLEYITFWNKATSSFFWVLEPDGSYTSPILTTAPVSGKLPEENRGWNWLALIHQDDQEALRSQWQEMIDLQVPFEAEVRVWHAASQQYRWFAHKAIPLQKNGALSGWVGASLDINDRVSAEHALLESENRFRAMADGTPVIIWLTDKDGNNEFINHAYQEYFGVTLEQVQSGGWHPLVHPQDADEYIKNATKSHQEKVTFHTQVQLRRFDGEWRWNEVYSKPRFSTTSEFLGMVGSAVDITDQVKARRYLERDNKDLEQLNQALRDFTSIASHDLQEPLRKIKAYGNLLEEKAGDKLGDQGREYLARMISAGDRMSTMIDVLLEYSRVISHVDTFVEVDLNNLVKEVLVDLEARILETGGSVHVEGLPYVTCDPLQIGQLFQNLIGNALKYHKQGVPPVVIISGKVTDLVEISVQDNGIGFNPANAQKIFEPFTRLHSKSKYEGTGMGLTICKKIVENHGGTITASSNPGEGSVFTVVLPINSQLKDTTLVTDIA